MTVKLEQYRIFKAIADTGNISRTAKQLYLSQSAVSQSLQQLESALGVRLFSRTARGVTLTAEGSVLYDYAAQALSLPAKNIPRTRCCIRTAWLISSPLPISASAV